MEIRITYRSEIYIEGKDLKEIKDKWLDLDLDPKGLTEEPEGVTDYGFIEITSVEDADSYDDLESEFLKV